MVACLDSRSGACLDASTSLGLHAKATANQRQAKAVKAPRWMRGAEGSRRAAVRRADLGGGADGGAAVAATGAAPGIGEQGAPSLVAPLVVGAAGAACCRTGSSRYSCGNATF